MAIRIVKDGINCYARITYLNYYNVMHDVPAENPRQTMEVPKKGVRVIVAFYEDETALREVFRPVRFIIEDLDYEEDYIKAAYRHMETMEELDGAVPA